MPSTGNIRDLLDQTAGILLNVVDLGRPLWFSDVCLASATCSQSAAAIRGALRERAGRAATPKMPAWFFHRGGSHASGISYDPGEAIVKAVGEGVERYCSQILNPRTHRVRYESYAALSAVAPVPPLESLQILGASAARFGAPTIAPLDPDAPIRWIECRRMADGEPAWMPLSMALVGVPLEPAERTCEQMGTGFACHESLDAALLGGLCEVVERDAIMGMWLRRLSPPRMDLDSCRDASPVVARTLRELDATRFTLCITDLTSDFQLPAFFVTAMSDRPPHTMIGAACHPDAPRALEKALLEILQSVSMFTNVDFDSVKAAGRLDCDSAVRDMHDHALRYGVYDLRDRFDFLVDAPVVPFASREPGVSRSGDDALYLDLTIPEIERVGLRVVKVMIPGAIPLSNRLENTPWGCPRLATYDRIFPRLREHADDLNPWINPFP